jgi:hypothetical protein
MVIFTYSNLVPKTRWNIKKEGKEERKKVVSREEKKGREKEGRKEGHWSVMHTTCIYLAQCYLILIIFH